MENDVTFLEIVKRSCSILPVDVRWKCNQFVQTLNFGRVQEPSTQIARMLALGSLLVSGWSSSGPSVPRTRRDVILAGAGAAALALPTPALAQRSALIPRSSKESTESFKAYKLSKPSEETEAFKAAEKRRIAGGYGTTPKEETAEETMRRLGMKTYGESLASGNPDPCGEGSFACGRKK